MKPIKKQRWSNIDIFGLLRGLGIWDSQYKVLQYVRRPFDTNLSIKDKILRLNDDQPSLTKQGILNGLSAEFGFDPYNVTETKVFPLTYAPVPSGGIGVQDIWVKVRAVGSTGVWSELSPQVWPSGYAAAKALKQGFIVWTNENYIDVSGYKNFNYNNSVEILHDLDDETELQIIYNIAYIDELNEKHTALFTDANNANDPNDKRYVFRKSESIDLISGITVYSLSDIPADLKSRYFNAEGHATEQLYTIKNYFSKQYQSTWDKIRNNSTIWDIQDIYCSGEIPNFYDSLVPKNKNWCIAESKSISGFFSGYVGGIDSVSNSLYLADIVQMESNDQEWYLRVYPGKFYIDGIPYRMFENPVVTRLDFVDGIADIPSGLTRGMYTILAVEGYYDGCTTPDEYLSGFVFEDYWAPTGRDGDSEWSNIYRRRPYLTAAEGYPINLELGQYNIDFNGGKIYLNSLYTSGTLIYDTALTPSGRIISFDVNPLNQTLVNLQKFFLYLVNKE